MLTSLEFLERGKQWPPESESTRLETYRANKLLFEDEHAQVYREQLKRIDRVIGNHMRVESFATILSYQRLITVKLGDLIFGEPPQITASTDEQQRVIDEIVADTDLLEVAKLAAIDVSRYGDGLMLVSVDDSAPRVDAISPAHWYPVVDPGNIRKIEHHVFAVPQRLPKSKQYILRVQIHSPADPANCEQHVYRLDGAEGAWHIGAEISDSNGVEPMAETQLQSCAVHRVPNMLASDRVYGLDDYGAIDSIVSELIIRVSQISRVLDKHASPSMTGPESALERDNITDSWRFRAGDYFPRHSTDEPPLEYVTWDASMDANFKQIDFLLQQLYTVSEMGSAVFGDLSNSTGAVPSGSALRRLMMSPLAKARRLANSFDGQLKRIISLCASIKGVTIDPRDISIKWSDGLPADEVEAASIMSVRTGGKPTISQYTAIRRLDSLGDADAAAELDEIRADDAADGMAAPMLGGGEDE